MNKTVFLILLSTIIAIGCGKKTETNVEYGYANKILYIANQDEPQAIDPHLFTGIPDRNIALALFEGLVTLDSKTLKPLPAASESWTISDDLTTYTFQLRKNARWSNGDMVTAEDFVYGWRRALTPTLPNLYAYLMYYVVNAEAYHRGEITDFSQVGIKALSPSQLQVTLNHPTNFFLQMIDHHSFYPVHRTTIEQHGGIDDALSKWTRPENFVGNGPFTLKSWQVNKEIAVQKNPHYWDADNVFLNEVHFLPITDQQVEVRAFRTGQVHLTNTPQMAIEKIAFFREKQPEALRITATYSTYFYYFNTTIEPLNDARVRRAIAMAIDRDLIVEKVTKGGEVPAYSIIPVDPNGYKPNTYFKFDIEEAKKLLAEAGYVNGKGFPTFEILYNTNDNHRKVAVAIQQMLKQNLNIDVQLINKEWKVYLDEMAHLRHDIARGGWIADYIDPTNFFTLLLSSAGNNRTGWKNADYDALLKAMEREPDDQKRYAIFEQANKMLSEAMPLMPIYYYSDINVVDPNIEGWYDNAMHYHPYQYVKFKNTTEK